MRDHPGGGFGPRAFAGPGRRERGCGRGRAGIQIRIMAPRPAWPAGDPDGEEVQRAGGDCRRHASGRAGGELRHADRFRRHVLQCDDMENPPQHGRHMEADTGRGHAGRFLPRGRPPGRAGPDGQKHDRDPAAGVGSRNNGRAFLHRKIRRVRPGARRILGFPARHGPSRRALGLDARPPRRVWPARHRGQLRVFPGRTTK